MKKLSDVKISKSKWGWIRKDGKHHLVSNGNILLANISDPPSIDEMWAIAAIPELIEIYKAAKNIDELKDHVKRLDETRYRLS